VPIIVAAWLSLVLNKTSLNSYRLNFRPQHGKMLVVLNDLKELPQSEIASILEIPVGTVKSRLFYARAALRKFFSKEGISL
jgi:DNA-directed RNA polymerase specialized sigma24 family protein